MGGFLAGLGFMLPGFILMLGLSVLYVEANLAGHLNDLFYGLTAAVGALVARALVRLGKSFISDVPLAVIAVVGFALTFWLNITFVVVLLGGGLSYELWKNGRRWTSRTNGFAISPIALISVATGAITVSLTAAIFFEGLKAGLLTFGGAFTVIPFLREAAVENHHWLTASQFNDGLAIGGILPAPLIIFSTFVGYIAGGLGGALVMTLGIFLPAFVFPIFLHSQLVAVSENERLHPFLLGVAAAVIGLIAAVTVTILETSITDVYGALIALGAFAALQRWHSKLTVVYVMAVAGILGVILQHTVV
jgi:chromate transporter